MKKLLALALVALMAGGAMAQDMDEFGLWVLDGEEYVNSLIDQAMYVPFPMFLTVHNTTTATIGGYECAVGLPEAFTMITGVDIHGGTNFGSNTNHLVGFPAPIPGGEMAVLAELTVMLLPGGVGMIIPVELGPAEPSSVDGVGPAYADGSDPNNLIACGYITGMPWVFTFGEEGPVGTENMSFSQVKALFN